MNEFPTRARVVIIGGGIVGSSTAYHLTKLGWIDVVLLEQGKLGGGTTWHAAGMVGRLRTGTSMTRINQASAELYSGLEAETGHSVGWKQVGSLIVAKSRDRLVQLRRTMAMAELFGVESHLISAAEARERWPLIQIDDILDPAVYREIIQRGLTDYLSTVGMSKIASGITKLSAEEQFTSTRHMMRELNRLGVTSLIDAGGGLALYFQPE